MLLKMKKIKLVAPVAMIVLATGLAFASANSSNEATQGKFIQLQNPERCEAVPEAECGNGVNLCTYEGQTVYEIKSDIFPTQCSEELREMP